MTPEGKVLAKVLKWLGKQKCDCYKVHGNMYQRSGEPDLTGSIKWNDRWLHFKLEGKAPVGKSTHGVKHLQAVRMNHWHQHAKVVGVFRSVEDVEILFNAYRQYMDGNQGCFREYIEAFDSIEKVSETGYQIYPKGKWEW